MADVLSDIPLRIPAGKVHLFDPDHDSMTYGPANEIAFGAKGGWPAGHAVVADDHFLLEQLLRDNPRIQVIEDRPAIYVCTDCDPPTEWKSKVAYRNHARSHVAAAADEDTPPEV